MRAESITHLKTHASRIVRDLADGGRTLAITQNGRAKAVIMSADTYERWTQALGLLKLLAHAEADVDAGRTVSGREAFRRARSAIRQARG
jgi:prevent-host-death family protein